MWDDGLKTAKHGAGGWDAARPFSFCGQWNEAILDACAISMLEPDTSGAGPKRGEPAQYDNPLARVIATPAA